MSTLNIFHSDVHVQTLQLIQSQFVLITTMSIAFERKIFHWNEQNFSHTKKKSIWWKASKNTAPWHTWSCSDRHFVQHAELATVFAVSMQWYGSISFWLYAVRFHFSFFFVSTSITRLYISEKFDFLTIKCSSDCIVSSESMNSPYKSSFHYMHT